MNELTTVATDRAVALSEIEARSVRDWQVQSRSRGTLRVYASAWKGFEAWCNGRGLAPMPASPETISAYIAAMADDGKALSTVQNIASAIGFMHRKVDGPNPVQHQHVRITLAGITRGLGKAPRHARAPATVAVIGAMVAHCDLDTLKGIRDRALLLTGFATAMRRSELAALDMTDLEHIEGDGFRITIRRSKGDQDGLGQTVGLIEGNALKPAEALRAWLDASLISSDRVFRSIAKGGKISDRVAKNGDMISGQAIADIIKHYTQAAGFECSDFSGHSLRSGFVTSALSAGASPYSVQDVTRHASLETLRGYDKRVNVFKDHAGAGFL